MNDGAKNCKLSLSLSLYVADVSVPSFLGVLFSTLSKPKGLITKSVDTLST